jgi:hypothetical protein
VLFHVQSAVVLLLIYAAVFNRRKRALHIRLAKTAIIWDIILVLQIEIARGAVEKAVHVGTNKWLLNYHVAVAISVVVLYIVTWILGRRLSRGDESVRPVHRIIGWLIVAMRTSTLITSYMIT